MSSAKANRFSSILRVDLGQNSRDDLKDSWGLEEGRKGVVACGSGAIKNRNKE